MELIRAFSAAVSPPFQPLETAGAGAGGSEFLWENYLINKAKKTVGFPVDRLEKYRLPLLTLRKNHYKEKSGKTRTARLKEFPDWLYQQNNVIVELDRDMKSFLSSISHYFNNRLLLP